MRVVGQSRRCSASEPQPPKKIVPAFVFFSRCVGSIKKKTEIALLRLERSGLKKGTGHSQKCMFMSGSLARTLNTKASLYVLKHLRPFHRSLLRPFGSTLACCTRSGMSETSLPLPHIIHSCGINLTLILESLDVFQYLVNDSPSPSCLEC